MDFTEEGVCVKAARDLLPGETIFSECPLVLGPKLPPEDGQVHCVGCCRYYNVVCDVILNYPLIFFHC